MASVTIDEAALIGLTVETQVVEINVPNSLTIGGGGGGTFDGVHNDLDGRSTSGAHPISAITGLQTELDELASDIAAIEPSESNLLSLTYLYHKPVTLSASDIAPPIAGLKIGFNAQATAAENGWYLSNGSGGVVTSGRTEILNIANLGLSVVAAGNFYDPDNLPPMIGGAEALGPLLNLNDAQDVRNTLGAQRFVVTTLDGSTFSLSPDNVAPEALLTQVLPLMSMNDYRVEGPGSIQLGVQACIVTADTTGGAVTITLGPHATLPRIVAIENYPDPGEPGADVTVVEYAGESDFETVIAPGCRCIIWPDQGAWHRWDLPPEYDVSKAGNMLSFDPDGNLIADLGAPTPSDDNAQALGTAAPGVGFQYARTDHVHAMPSAADVGAQPLDSDLTAIAALATEALGRSLLTAADHAALMTLIALVAGDIPDLAASKITSGTMATARLGSGTANSTTFLRGDQTYAAPPASAPTSVLAYATDTYLLASRDLGVGHTSTANGSVYTSAGMFRYYPMIVPVSMSVKALALWITGGNAGASAVWRAGLYADNGSGLPGSVLIDGGTASIGSTGVKELSFSPVSLTAGDRIWFCSGFQGLDTGSTNPSYSAVTSSTTAIAETSPQASTSVIGGYYEKTGVTGALGANPAPTISRNTVNSCPNLWLKAA